MIYDAWTPTVGLRFVERAGEGRKILILQQRWTRQTIEYRDYGGRPRRCVGTEAEWRDVPKEKADDDKPSS